MDDLAQGAVDPPLSKTVAIIPDAARTTFSELLRALEEAYEVRFVGSGAGEIDSASAVIVFPGGRRPERLPIPCLVLQAPGADEHRGSWFAVDMSRCLGLDRALHGQRLVEYNRTPPAPVEVGRGSTVLAV